MGSKTRSGPQQNQNSLPHPSLLRGAKEGGNATPPLHSRGVPNKGEQNQNSLPHLCFLGGPKEGGNATSPLHSRGSPTKGEQNQNSLPHPRLLGAQKRAEMLWAPAVSVIPNARRREQNQKWSPTKRKKISSGPQQRGTKSEVATSPVFSWGPKRGQECYVTPAFSGVPNKGQQSENWLPHPCLVGCPKEGGKAMSALHSRGSPTPGATSKMRSGPQQRERKSEAVPNKGEQNQKRLPQPGSLGGPKEGGNSTSLLHSQASPTKWNKIRTRSLTPTFSGAQKRAEMLRHLRILRGPQHQARGPKSEVLPNKGEQNQNWLPHP